jgi:diguanylate cyclase (GGDEF)-like protein
MRGSVRSTQGETVTSNPTKILVVDDEPIICSLVADTLITNGQEVLCALDGAEGLKVAKQERPDLIILDIMMPDMDGYEVCRQLRGNFRTSNTPIIMLTALDQTPDIVKGMDEGADDYITKPFHPSELRSRVKSHLQRSKRDMESSPLTGLPGNLAVEQALRERIESGKLFAVCYFDLDNFKPYNDKYGFVAGDVVLKMLSEFIISAVIERGNASDFIGHEGGDDFIVITTPERTEAICDNVVTRFDEAILDQYDEEDRAQGYCVSYDRRGNEVAFPFMSLSVAIVTNERRELVHSGQIAQIAAEVLKYAKTVEGSKYRFDMRGSDK